MTKRQLIQEKLIEALYERAQLVADYISEASNEELLILLEWKKTRKLINDLTKSLKKPDLSFVEKSKIKADLLKAKRKEHIEKVETIVTKQGKLRKKLYKKISPAMGDDRKIKVNYIMPTQSHLEDKLKYMLANQGKGKRFEKQIGSLSRKQAHLASKTSLSQDIDSIGKTRKKTNLKHDPSDVKDSIYNIRYDEQEIAKYAARAAEKARKKAMLAGSLTN